MKKILLTKALTREERYFIWDCMHTHVADQDAKGILLKSEMQLFQLLEPLLRPTPKKKH